VIPDPRAAAPDPDVRTAVTWWAIMLARDVETCRALLRGEPVEPGRLDPVWLARAKAQHLVTLDVLAVDVLPTIAYARRLQEVAADAA
jgi:hypothetical protein